MDTVKCVDGQPRVHICVMDKSRANCAGSGRGCRWTRRVESLNNEHADGTTKYEFLFLHSTPRGGAPCIVSLVRRGTRHPRKLLRQIHLRAHLRKAEGTRNQQTRRCHCLCRTCRRSLVALSEPKKLRTESAVDGQS